MHELTTAEAIGSGRPAVVAYATPAFCQSRVCGPLMDAVVDPLFERYADRVAFIHVEPFLLAKARGGEFVPVPTVDEWGLQTEPWIFIIDQERRVACRFEAIVALEEVEPVLERVFGDSARGSRPACCWMGRPARVVDLSPIPNGVSRRQA